MLKFKFMSIALIWLALFMMAQTAGALVYYVSTTGANTAPYDTWAKAANLPSTAVTAGNGTTGPHTMYIAAGTYTGNLSLQNANWTWGKIIGAGMSSTIIQYTSGVLVTLATADSITISDVTLKVSANRSAVDQSAGSVYNTFNRCCFTLDGTGTAGAGDSFIRIRGDDAYFDRCCFLSGCNSDLDYTYCINAGTNSSGSITNCIFEPYQTYPSSGGINLGGSGTWNFINNTVSGSIINGVATGNNGTFNIYNNIISVNSNNYGTTGHLKEAVSGTTGTGARNIKNNILMGNCMNAHLTHDAATVYTGNLDTVIDPKFTSYARCGYIIPRMDDNMNWVYMQDIIKIWQQYGASGTLFLYHRPNPFSGAKLDTLKTLIASGTVEVAAHSWSHPTLTYTHAIWVIYRGAGSSPTCAFDGSFIRLTAASNVDSLTIAVKDTTRIYDVAYTGASTLHHDYGTKWTLLCSTTGSQDSSSVGQYATMSECATMTATACPCYIDFNVSGLVAGKYKKEISDPKTTWEALLTGVTDPQTGAPYSCNTFSAPFGTTNGALRALGASAGYIGWVDPVTRSKSYMSKINLSNIDYLDASTYLCASTEDSVRQKARAIGWGVKKNGWIVGILAHTTAQLSAAQWGYCMDEWQKLGIPMKSAQQVALTIKNSGSWTHTDSLYTRAFANTLTDLKVKSGSPGIDKGDDTALPASMCDFFGIPKWGVRDIGAAEYRPSYARQGEIRNEISNEITNELHNW